MNQPDQRQNLSDLVTLKVPYHMPVDIGGSKTVAAAAFEIFR